MTKQELDKRIQEIKEENKRTDAHLAQVRKEALERINRENAKLLRSIGKNKENQL